MPGPITHLKAAYCYNREHDFEFGDELYLGSISPDCVNLNGHAPKSLRWPAHLRSADLNKWVQNARLFYNVNKGKINESLLRGYILHILTDIVWDRSFDQTLYNLLLGIGIQPENLKTERWNEIYGYEQTELTSPWLVETVLPSLKKATLTEIGTLDVSCMSLWRDKVAEFRLEKGKPPRFADNLFMKALFEEVNRLSDEIFG